MCTTNTSESMKPKGTQGMFVGICVSVHGSGCAFVCTELVGHCYLTLYNIRLLGLFPYNTYNCASVYSRCIAQHRVNSRKWIWKVIKASRSVDSRLST